MAVAHRRYVGAALLVAAAVGLGGGALSAAGSAEVPASDRLSKQVIAPDRLPVRAVVPVSTAPLALGSQGFDVWQVQNRLLALGYFLPSASGYLDDDTEQALWALQKVGGVERTGVVDAATRQLLAEGVVPVPEAGLTRGIEIDLDRQILMTIEDGAVTHIVNASSGSGIPFTGDDGRRYTAQTTRGRFSVHSERNYNHESTLGVGSMYRPKYFNGMMAIHGAPEVPPVPSSHGCVRVSDHAMDWLWDTWGLPLRTPVVVR